VNKILSVLTSVGETFNALAPMIRTILIILIVGLVYFVAADFSSKSKLDTYITEYKAYQKSTDSALRFVEDSVTKVVQAHQKAAGVAMNNANEFRDKIKELERTRPSKDSVQKLQAEIEELKRGITDSVEMARIIIPAQETLIAKQKQDLVWYINVHMLDSEEKSNLRVAIVQKDSIIDKQALGLVRLQNQLTKLPDAPKHERLLGFIPMPSRKVAFVAGTIVGAVGILKLSKIP
jgi:hypothetical protein